MFYLWWLIIVVMYLGILLFYAILVFVITPNDRSDSLKADTVFFAICSIVTLSIMPLIRVNIYGSFE